VQRQTTARESHACRALQQPDLDLVAGSARRAVFSGEVAGRAVRTELRPRDSCGPITPAASRYKGPMSPTSVVIPEERTQSAPNVDGQRLG